MVGPVAVRVLSRRRLARVSYRDTIRSLLAPEKPEKPSEAPAPASPSAGEGAGGAGPSAPLVARAPDGKWIKGMSGNPGGRPRSLKQARQWLSERTDNGRELIEPLIAMAEAGYMARGDGSIVQLSPGEVFRIRAWVYEALHGKAITVKGKVAHSGSVGVHGSIALEYDVKKLDRLSQEDLDRLEALASVLMPDAPEDADIVDVEPLAPVDDPLAGGDPSGAG